MKVAINRKCGVFEVNQEWADTHNIDPWEISRTDKELISAIENGENVGGEYSTPIVVEIPDNATDWEIVDYDGMETVIAVVNGKIVHI